MIPFSALRVKTADRFLLASFLRVLLFVFSIFAAIAFALVLFDDLDRIREYGLPLNTALMYVSLRAPHEILKTTPMIIVLSVMLFAGDMIRHREMLMLSVAGYSNLRLAAPIAAFLAVLVAALFFAYERAAGPAAAMAHNLLESRAGGGGGLANQSGLWLPGKKGRVFFARNYIPYLNEVRGLSVFTFEGPGETLSERIDAASARWDPEGPGIWILEDVTARFIREDGSVRRETHEIQTYALERSPSDFERMSLDPEYMSRGEIAKVVGMIRSAGEDPRRYLADLRIKEAFPFAAFFMGLLAFGIALRTGAGGRASGLGIGLLSVIGYFMAISLGKSLAGAGALPPWLGAWAPNLLAMGAAAALLFDPREIPRKGEADGRRT